MLSTGGRAIGVICLVVLLASPGPAKAEANTLTCVLDLAGTEFRGTCDVPCSVNALAIDIDGPNPRKACNSPARTVLASLHKTGAASWLGTMEGKFPEDPTRFELVTSNTETGAVAKTPFGWFRVKVAEREGDSLHLAIAANNQLPPTQDDIRIIERAKALLRDETVWNRQDDRTCPDNPRTWSLFCALQQSTREIVGGVHYRQPALQMVREVLNEVGGSRLGKHRLMDYNNHRDTTLAEVHDLLTTARTRLASRFQ